MTKLVLTANKSIEILYQNISSHIHSARQRVVQSVNTEMVKAYWKIGCDIVEEEQRGKAKAGYGAELIKLLSQRLTKEFGRGFGIATLENARKFYLVYSQQKSYAVRRKSDMTQFNPGLNLNLSWTHYRALMRESRDGARAFYEKEAIRNCWSGRELERQIGYFY